MGRSLTISGTLYVAGNLHSQRSSYNSISGAIQLTGSGTQTITSAGGDYLGFYGTTMTINKSGGSAVLGSDVLISTLIINNGNTFDVSTDNRQLTVTTFTNNGSFNARSGTVIFDGSNVTITPGSSIFNNVNFSQTWGDLTISGTLYVAGNIYSQRASYIPISGAIQLTGSGTQTITSAGGDYLGFYGTTMTIAKSSGSAVLGSDVLISTLIINNGNTFDVSTDNRQLTVTTFTNNGSFNARSGTVIFDGQVVTITPGSSIFNNVNFSSTWGDPLTISGTLYVAGNLHSQRSSYNSISGAIQLTGSGTQTITSAGGDYLGFYGTTMIINKSGGSVVLGSDVLITTLDINANNTFNCAGFGLTSDTINNSGTFQLQGDEAVSVAPNNASGSTVEYMATFGSRDVKSWTYKTLKINGSGGIFTVPVGGLTLGEDLIISAGNLDDSSNATINVGGNWSCSGTFTRGTTGTVNFNASVTGKTIASGSQAFRNVTFNGSASNITWSLNDPMSIGGTLGVTTGILSVTKDITVTGATTIGASGTIQLDASSNAVTFTQGNGTTLSNSGSFKVANSNNAATLTSGGTFIFSGTAPDTNGNTLKLGKCSALPDITISSGKLEIIANSTIGAVAISGGEFSCTTDGVTITGNTNKAIILNSGTLTLNPTIYSTGITVTGIKQFYIYGGTLDINHLTASTTSNINLFYVFVSSLSVTNFSNSTFTNNSTYNGDAFGFTSNSVTFTMSNCIFNSHAGAAINISAAGTARLYATNCTFNGADSSSYSSQDILIGNSASGTRSAYLINCTFNTVGFYDQSLTNFLISRNDTAKTWDIWGTLSSSTPTAGWNGSDITSTYSDYAVSFKAANYVSTGSYPTFTQDQNITCKSLNIGSNCTWQINTGSPSAAITLTLKGSLSGTLTNNGTLTFGTLTSSYKATITSDNTTKIPWAGTGTVTWKSFAHLAYQDLKTNSIDFTTGINNSVYIDSTCDFKNVTISSNGTLDDSSNSTINVAGNWSNSGAFIYQKRNRNP